MAPMRLARTLLSGSILALTASPALAGPSSTLPCIAVTFAQPVGAGGLAHAPTHYGFGSLGDIASFSKSSLSGSPGFSLGIDPAATGLTVEKLNLNFHFNGLILIESQSGPSFTSAPPWSAPSDYVDGNSDIPLVWQSGGIRIGDTILDPGTGQTGPAFANLVIDTSHTTSDALTLFVNDTHSVTAQALSSTPEPGTPALLLGLLAATLGLGVFRRRRARAKQTP